MEKYEGEVLLKEGYTTEIGDTHFRNIEKCVAGFRGTNTEITYKDYNRDSLILSSYQGIREEFKRQIEYDILKHDLGDTDELDELVEIADETVQCGRIFGIDPKVAFLSYSTFGSGKGEDVDKMRNAAEKTKLALPNIPVEGELQFDAAVYPRVAQTKCPDSEVAGYANTFIFPDINAGNIGYKIAQRLGNFEAYGPILLGLNAPINDLSRGCNAQEVYSMAIITAALA